MKKLVRFLVSGATAAAVEYGTFLVLYTVLFDEQYLVVAQSISFMAGFIVSFLLNKHWVFQTKGKSNSELVRYTILAGVNLLLSNILLLLLTSELGIIYWLAKFIIMATIAIWNYVIFQKIVFKSKS